MAVTGPLTSEVTAQAQRLQGEPRSSRETGFGAPRVVLCRGKEIDVICFGKRFRRVSPEYEDILGMS